MRGGREVRGAPGDVPTPVLGSESVRHNKAAPLSKVLALPVACICHQAANCCTILLSVMLNGCETWPALENHTQRLKVFQMICLRFLCGWDM